MGDLRERLATLYLDREYDGESTLQQSHPGVRSACYDSADATLTVVADWLRDEAKARERAAGPDPLTGPIYTDQTYYQRMYAAHAIAALARALTHPDTTEQP